MIVYNVYINVYSFGSVMFVGFKEVIHDRIVIEYDMHHTPIEHLNYVERVLPQYPVSADTRLQIEQEDAKIRNGTYNRNHVPNTGIVRL